MVNLDFGFAHLDHSSENSMFVIKPGSWYQSNEELRTISVRASVSHRHCVWPESEGVRGCERGVTCVRGVRGVWKGCVRGV